MSAQFGFYSFSSLALDESDLTVLRGGAALHAPMGSTIVASPVAMGYAQSQRTDAFELGRKPARSASGAIVTFLGRLDNRTELIDHLRDKCEYRCTDTELILAVWDKWGSAGFGRLIGDWSIAVWDRRESAVFLARDSGGVSPLYYYLMPEFLAWSSEIEPLVRLCRENVQLEEKYLANFLVNYPPTSLTPYKDVSAVPVGRWLRLTPSGVQKGVVWQPDLSCRLHYRRNEDYDEQFRSVFGEAVKSRMRVPGAVWCELSGGMDSSSIVCLASRSISNSEVLASDLHTITYTFDESTSADEREYSERVSDEIKRTRHVLPEDGFSLFAYSRSAFVGRPQLGPGRAIAVGELMASSGAKVLMSGTGGDAVMMSPRRPCLELYGLLRNGSFLRLFRRTSEFASGMSSSYWDLLWNDAIRPVCAPSRINAWKRHIEPWMLPNLKLLAGPTSVEDAIAQVDGPLEKRRAYDFILDSIKVVSYQYFRTSPYIEPTYPYLDQRLIQFMLSIPEDQKQQPEGSRVLHRRALKGILTERVRLRTSKAGGQEVVCRAIARDWPWISHLFNKDCIIAERNYVDLARLRTALERARLGHAPDIFSLLRAICLESWLRLEQHQFRAAAPVRQSSPLHKVNSEVKF